MSGILGKIPIADVTGLQAELDRNASVPALAAMSYDQINLTTATGAAEVLPIQDYNSSYYYCFISHPSDVTGLVFLGTGIGAVKAWLAGLPNCISLSLAAGGTYSAFEVANGENVETLDFTGVYQSGNITVPAGLTGLTSAIFSNSTSLAAVEFAAGAHPALALVDFAGCSYMTTANTDSTLVSLEAANTSVMVGATFQGNGSTGTDMSYSLIASGASTNLIYTRTAGNLAQLVVQPSIAYVALTGTDGPIGLTVTGDTSTGRIVAKFIQVSAMAAATSVNFTGYAYLSKTLTGGSSYTFTAANVQSGRSLDLYFTQSGASAVTVAWFNTITWAGGAPSYVNGQTTKITLVATGANTFNGSWVANTAAPAQTTAAQIMAAVNLNANAATMVAVTAGSGVQTGAVGAMSLANCGNLTISKLVARGWTINLSLA